VTPSQLETAVRAAVVTASGLDPSRVYFADQPALVPETATRIAVRVGEALPLGTDGLEHDFDATRPAGQEVEYRTFGMREVTIELQAFGPVEPPSSSFPARDVLARVLDGLVLPSVRDMLNAAGVGVLRESAVRRIPGVRGPMYEDRALLELVVLVRASAVERTGYIASAEVTRNVTS
jgi:hypothetical protein